MQKDSGTKELLISAGLEIARESGIRRLTVRGLSSKAGVNPGGFVYHFGTREAFLEVLLERWYAPLFQGLQIRLEENLAPVEGLRAVMYEVLDFVGSQGRLIVNLLLDALSGEEAVRRFLLTIPMRHPLIIMKAIERAQAAGAMVQAPPLQVAAFVVGASGLPMLMGNFFSGQGAEDVPAFFDQLRGLAVDSARARQRVDWALKGVVL